MLDLVCTKIESCSVDSFSEITIKQLNLLNATIRLLQAQQRLDNRKLIAVISLISSIMSSSLVSIICYKLFPHS